MRKYCGQSMKTDYQIGSYSPRSSKMAPHECCRDPRFRPLGLLSGFPTCPMPTGYCSRELHGIFPGGGMIHMEAFAKRRWMDFGFGPKTSTWAGSSGNGFRHIPCPQARASLAVNAAKANPLCASNTEL